MPAIASTPPLRTAPKGDPCDTVILAIGQASDLSFLTPADGVETTRQGTVRIDQDTLMTTAPGIFAAGDIAFGPRLIINAVADGKKAAEQIDRYLRGQAWQPKPRFVQITVLDHHSMPEFFDEYSRLPVPMISLDRRTGVTEVESGYTEEQARMEAQRCLHCWVNTIFDGNEAEGTECILCGGCVDVCPQNCLQLVPLSQIARPGGCPGPPGRRSRISPQHAAASGTGRPCRRGGIGDAEGRNHLYPLRVVRRALSRAHYHHGSFRSIGLRSGDTRRKELVTA